MIVESSEHGLEGAEAEQARVDEVVSQGPRGAIALAGAAVILVVAMWFAFYLLVFVPRG